MIPCGPTLGSLRCATQLGRGLLRRGRLFARCWHPFLGETDGFASSSCRRPPVETRHLDSSLYPEARAVVCCATQPTLPTDRLALAPGRERSQCAAATVDALEAHALLRLLLARRDAEGRDECHRYGDQSPHTTPPLRRASRSASVLTCVAVRGFAARSGMVTMAASSLTAWRVAPRRRFSAS